ncbi:MAG: sulfatase-like hydrolase/transferase [Planctomycetes bacterium]|nr:sulfatase-like hydrolase/transferase [Planctomycetota bacterium]
MTANPRGPNGPRHPRLACLLRVLAACALGPPVHAQTDPPPPNFVVILADDLGYGELGVQGSTDIPTPRIDSIAESGIRFTSAYVSSPVCAPSRAGLLTGRYQQRFGFGVNPGPEAVAEEEFGLPRSEPTLAERLKAAGYATGMVGKWHVGYRDELTPPARGFDEFFGFLSASNDYLPRADRPLQIRHDSELVEVDQYLTDAFGQEATAFIERHAEEPFFLYLAFNAVHRPLQATAADEQRFAGTLDARRRTFAAMTAAMDDAVGEVLDCLRAHGLEERTLVFFLSDNGGPTPQTTSSNRPLTGFKGQLLEGGIRVPFLLQWKGTLPAGRTFDHPVIALDIVPTVLAAARHPAQAQDQLDGVNLLPWLLGTEQLLPHQVLFWRHKDGLAIRKGDLKLVRLEAAERPRLYDVAADPCETTDLAEQRPEEAHALLTAWEAWNAELPDPLWQRQYGREGNSALGEGSLTRKRFDSLDKNHDGAVDREEFLSSRYGSRRAASFDGFDQNGDGQVTWDEVEEWTAEETDAVEAPDDASDPPLDPSGVQDAVR